MRGAQIFLVIPLEKGIQKFWMADQVWHDIPRATAEAKFMHGRRTTNRFISNLGKACLDRLIDEKWLLAPSLRIGQQWLDSLTRSGMPVANCRLFTVAGMAMRFAEPVIHALGLSFCNQRRQLFLLDGILGSLPPNSSAYFSRLQPGLALSKRVCSIVISLELAGIGPDDVAPHNFDSETKYADFVFVFREYTNYLQEKSLVDYSQALKIAAETIRNAPSTIGKDWPFFMIPNDLELCELEKRLLASIPSDRVVPLPVDGDELDWSNPLQTDEDRINQALRLLMESESQPAVDFFAAVGESNEIKEVLRRCSTDEIPFDDIEIVHTDTESYVPVIYETILGVSPDPLFDWSDLPVTFADGIPAAYSRPGRALKGWIEWISDDFPQAKVVHLIEDGLLDFGAEYADDSHFLALGRVLRKVVIVNVHDRYLPALRQFLERERKTDTESEQTEWRADDSAQDPSDLRIDMETLYRFLERLLEISKIAGMSARVILDHIRVFVSELSRCVNEVDNYARLAILEELDSLHEWLSDEANSVTFDILQWVRDLPNTVRILGSGPRPGCLHISQVMSGGQSGRKHLFIVGLDHERFPGSPSIDPLLLDEERQKISDSLATSAKNHERKLIAFSQLLARQTGNICFSYSSRDLRDDSSTMPSSVFQAAWRSCHPQTDAAIPETSSDVLSPVSFVPEPGNRICTSREWWLQKIVGGRPLSKRPLCQKFFPNLTQGLISSDARASDVFTEYDGWVGDAGGAFDPTAPSGPILSVQRFETFGKCPLSYFFRYILSASPPDEPGMDTAQWLTAMESGILLHEVFRAFIEEVMQQGRQPLVSRDHPRLKSLLQQYVDQSRSAHPPPSMSALYRQLRILEGAADIFLCEEEIASRSLIPRFVEVSIGLPKDGSRTAVDQDTPEILEIEPGVFIRIRGKVDRIDESVDSAENEFVVWDYKTGGTYRYQGSDLFHQGRNLQHAIYVAIAGALLKRRHHPASRVSKFGYYFPSVKGRGIRIVTLEDAEGGGIEIIRRLCRMMSRGCFPPTNSSSEDCTFCEYAEVCGDVENVARQARKKIANECNKPLEDFRSLRGVS